MPKIRKKTIDVLERHITDRILSWTHRSKKNSLNKYVLKNGVAHLLAQGRMSDAENRILDLHFMSGFINSWEVIIEPLTAWRLLGEKLILEGVADKVVATDPKSHNTEVLDTISVFVREASLFVNDCAIRIHEARLAAHISQQSDTKKLFNCKRDLGTALMDSGELLKAQEIFEELLELEGEKLGRLDPDVVWARNEFGVLLGRRGLFKESNLLLESVRADFLALEGRLSRKYLIVTTSVSWWSMKFGDFEKSEKLLREAIQGMEETLEPADPHFIRAKNQLLTLLRVQGRTEEAFQLAQSIHQNILRLLGKQHPLYIQILNEIGSLQLSNEEYLEAEVSFRQVADIQKKYGKEQDPMSIMNLSIALLRQDKLDDASASFEASFDRARELNWAEDHLDMLLLKENAIELLIRQSRLHEAEECYLSLIADLKRVAGTMHLRTIQCAASLGYLHEQMEEPDKAEELYKSLIENHKKVFGEQHVHTIDVIERLSLLYRRQGRHEEALPLCLSLFESYLKSSGEDHQFTILSAESLAMTYKKLGNFAQAEPLFFKVLTSEENSLGEEHPDTVMTRYNHGICLFKIEAYEKSYDTLEKVLMAERKIHGPESSQLVLTYWHLAQCQNRLGNYKKAAEHRRKCWELELEDDELSVEETLQSAQALTKDLLAADEPEEAQIVVTAALHSLGEKASSSLSDCLERLDKILDEG